MHAAAALHNIELRPLSCAPGDPDSRAYFCSGDGKSLFSAYTLRLPTSFLIIFNDAHEETRIASSVAHELSHFLLLHVGTPPLMGDGQRTWDGSLESEASRLGGHLLVPDAVGRWAANSGVSLAAAAAKYGVSPAFMQWRMGASGGTTIARRRTPR
ncbi:MAG: ImmA/IrrE family metallo-endopeptidase [Candidatus Dormibacteria bacterium]